DPHILEYPREPQPQEDRVEPRIAPRRSVRQLFASDRASQARAMRSVHRPAHAPVVRAPARETLHPNPRFLLVRKTGIPEPVPVLKPGNQIRIHARGDVPPRPRAPLWGRPLPARRSRSRRRARHAPLRAPRTTRRRGRGARDRASRETTCRSRAARPLRADSFYPIRSRPGPAPNRRAGRTWLPCGSGIREARWTEDARVLELSSPGEGASRDRGDPLSRRLPCPFARWAR